MSSAVRLLAGSALCVLLGIAPAFAWSIEESEGVFYTYQLDQSGRYYLTLDCDATFGMYSLSIEGSEAWDPTTSYAPEVPTIFVIDGIEMPTASLAFVNVEDTVAVMISQGQTGFPELYDALRAATGTVEVSYFDKAMSFDVDGIADAFDVLDSFCWD
jgi:hypothetical protein